MIGAFVSDVHSEKYSSQFSSLKNYLDKIPDADFVVLAGDIGAPFSYGREYGPPMFLKVIEYFCKRYKHVLYTPGNHDLWLCKSLLQAIEYFNTLHEQFPNFISLINRKIDLEGKKIFGGPLWFHSSSDPYFFLKKQSWIDFHLMPNTTLDEHDWLSDNFKQNLPNNCDLVISHHLPTPKSINPYYLNDSSNCFFLNDCTKLIEEKNPKIWIHGHTHSRASYLVGDTQVLCNPMGYPGEDLIEDWFIALRTIEI